MKLSIVIPAYNVANYLIKCVKSCELQLKSTHDIEIIIVDDGSTDNTYEVVGILQDKYDNIVYVRQENKGQASARNTGLENAKGDYVWFVDGDDFLTPTGIDGLLEKAISKSLDLIAFNLQFVNEKDKISPYVIATKSVDGVLDSSHFVENVSMPHSPCIALFNRQFLIRNRLGFKTDIYFEDFEFTVRTYSLVERVEFIDEPHYNYFQREGSTMKSSSKEKNIKRSRDLISIADSFYRFMLSRDFDDNVNKWIFKNINFAVLQSIAYYSKEAYDLTELKEKPYFPLHISKDLKFIAYIKERLMNFSPKLYTRIYKFIR